MVSLLGVPWTLACQGRSGGEGRDRNTCVRVEIDTSHLPWVLEAMGETAVMKHTSVSLRRAEVCLLLKVLHHDKYEVASFPDNGGRKRTVEGILIPARWVQAAQKLGQMIDITPSVSGITGLDVGGGKSESVAITFKAPVVLKPSTWGNPDTSNTARKGLQWAMDTGAQHLNYDAPGVGIGVASTLKHTDVGAMRVVGVNTGNPPTSAVWPDGRTAKEKFGNLKAELWWVLRERFQRTYEHVTWLEKQQAEKTLSDCNPSIGVSPAGDAVPGLFSDAPYAGGEIPEKVSQSVTAGTETSETERDESETISPPLTPLPPSTTSIGETVTGDDEGLSQDAEDLSRPYLDTDDEEDQGREHPIDELISLPTECHTLVTQLSTKG
jgi:hypothetical protein